MLRTGLIRTQLALCAALLLCEFGDALAADEIVSGEFELIDQHGQPVTERSFDGKLRLVFFGYTECPDVCPTTLLEVARAMQLLGDDAAQVQPLFISIDRNNDTPQRIASYVGAFHPGLIGLTGSERQLAAAARAFNVTYGVEPGGLSGADGIFHSSYLFLMDRQGRFLDVFGYGSKAAEIAAKVRDYL